MIYIVSIFILVIAVTIAYIARTYAWLVEQKVYRVMNIGPLVVEHRHHKVETLSNHFMYTTMHDFNTMPFRYALDREPNHHISHGDSHLARIKHDYTHKLAQQMLEGGLIEIQEREDHYGPNPWCKRVQMTVKVVRPEPNHIVYR